MDEVVRPYVIWMLWPQTDARSIVEPEPPMTAAKIQMIDASKSSIDEIHEHLIENMAGDVATRKQLTAPRETGREIARFRSDRALATEHAVRRIWRQNAVTDSQRTEEWIPRSNRHARRNQSVAQVG